MIELEFEQMMRFWVDQELVVEIQVLNHMIELGFDCMMKF
jgi:hypothetical protein